jgi:hypothetical protein
MRFVKALFIDVLIIYIFVAAVIAAVIASAIAAVITAVIAVAVYDFDACGLDDSRVGIYKKLYTKPVADNSVVADRAMRRRL